MISPSEPYVPFFHAKGDNGDVAKDPHPTLIPLKTTEGYDNQGTHNYLCAPWISAVIDLYTYKRITEMLIDNFDYRKCLSFP